MSHFLRAPEGELGRLLAIPGTMIHEQPFITSASLAMHDECASAHGVSGHPWDEGRAGFSEQASQPLCWSPGDYSSERTTPCYWCGEGI